MQEMGLEFFQTGGLWLAAGLLCLGGLFLSLLSLSGTWLVVLAAGLLTWAGASGYPGWRLTAGFALFAVLVELFEYVASFRGITRRGGSAWTGWAALGGGLLGFSLGGAIPIPLLGPPLGLLAGGFLAAFIAEYLRMKNREHAVHVAFGVLLARLQVLVVKTVVTFILTAWLLAGAWLHRGGG